MNEFPTIEVIICTLANAEREQSLIRAIESVVNQPGINARPLVVVNGSVHNKELVDYLLGRLDISVHFETIPSLPLAIEAGRKLVSAPYFSFLDDDDTYVPNTLANRVAPFAEDESLAVVISGGRRRREDGSTTSAYAENCFDPKDPIGSLMTKNWLASCGGTFRKKLVEPEIFHKIPKYYEWTTVALRLCLAHKRMLYSAQCAFEINETEASLSRSSSYVRSSPAVLKQMLSCDVPSTSRKKLKQKLSRALHSVAELDLREGNRLNALKSHLASMNSLYGLLRYVLYTRKLFGFHPKPTTGSSRNV